MPERFVRSDPYNSRLVTAPGLAKQHLIDPEICIRCGTCEATCTVGAVTHDDRNYVVQPEVCGHCLDCIGPCPTGAIDNWRIVRTPYPIEDQFAWTELPEQERPKRYVQDHMRANSRPIAALLRRDLAHIFICGLKGMETGVDDALHEICRENRLDWAVLKPQMRASGRYHVETY